MKKLSYFKYEKDADHELVEILGLETTEKFSWKKFRSNSNWLLLLLYYFKDLMNN